MAGRAPEAAEDAHRALALARELGNPTGEARALTRLTLASQSVGDTGRAVEWAGQADQIDPGAVPGWITRRFDLARAGALMDAGQLDGARRICASALSRAREVGDLQDQADFLWHIAELDRRAGNIADAGTHLRESLEFAVQTGDRLRRIDCLDTCGHLCAASGHTADALTVWAAHAAQTAHAGLADWPQDALRRQEPLQQARRALGPARTCAAEERGTAMTLETAAEFATMLTAPDRQTSASPPAIAQLSAREGELVTLVAQGHTDAQIAAQLYISVSTVRSHLDRIRDKTGCRRRADLTRLALQAGLV
jgi:DNA-binding CsgD family transcriptional regulator